MDKWAKIEDIKPPKDTQLIFFGTYKKLYSGNFMFMGSYNNEGIFSISEAGGWDMEKDFYDEEVTHWMLPPKDPNF